MYGQRQFDGHLATLYRWHIARPTAQHVGHQRAYINVVAIVVGTVLAAVYVIWHSSPLCPIACSLQGSWQSADGAEACDISHTSAKAYGISGDHAFLIALV